MARKGTFKLGPDSGADCAPDVAGEIAKFATDSRTLHLLKALPDGSIFACSCTVERKMDRPTGSLKGIPIWELLGGLDEADLKRLIREGDNEPRRRHIFTFVDHNRIPFTLECMLAVQPDGFLLVGEPCQERHALIHKQLFETNNGMTVLLGEHESKTKALVEAMDELAKALTAITELGAYSRSPEVPRGAADGSLSLLPLRSQAIQHLGQGSISVVVCDNQPVVAEGIRTFVSGCDDITFQQRVNSLRSASELLAAAPPSVLLIDRDFGTQNILNWLADLRLGAFCDPSSHLGIVIWGASFTDFDICRFVKTGARGILRKTAEPPIVVDCLRAVGAGGKWVRGELDGESQCGNRAALRKLTSREQQVLKMLEEGSQNKDIAEELGIRLGTVKIHTRHVLRKKGVRQRFELLL